MASVDKLYFQDGSCIVDETSNLQQMNLASCVAYEQTYTIQSPRAMGKNLLFCHSRTPHVPSGFYYVQGYGSYGDRYMLEEAFGHSQYAINYRDVEVFRTERSYYMDSIDIIGYRTYRYRISMNQVHYPYNDSSFYEHIYLELCRYGNMPYSNHFSPLQNTVLAGTCVTKQLTEKEKPMSECSSYDSDIPKDLSIMERLTASADDKVLIKAGYLANGELTSKAKNVIAALNYQALKAQLVTTAQAELDDAKET